MKIIIVGGGKVGQTLIEHLSNEGHDIILIDNDQKKLEEIVNKFDILGYCGNGADYEMQIEAGTDDAQLFVSTTSSDELNILCALIAKKAGAQHTIARVRNPEYLKQFPFFKDELGLSMIVNPELDTANEISKVLRFPNAINVESFYRGLVDLAELKIEAGNGLCDMKLMDIFSTYNVKILVCAVQRKNEVIIPRGDFVLKEGDKIHITAPSGVLVEFMKKLKIYKHRTKDIMIVGGGKMGYYLAKQLCNSGGYKVKLIENNFDRCEKLSEVLPNAEIINGDGTDRAVLLEQGLEAQDAFVALTTIDEENIITSMYASSLGIRKTVAKVNRVSPEVLESIGMDSAFSSKKIAANRIIGYVRALENSGEESSVEALYKLVDGKVEALEFQISADFDGANVPLKDLKIKEDTLIACIMRNHKVIFPGGNDSIETGDHVVVVTKANHISSINEVFE